MERSISEEAWVWVGRIKNINKEKVNAKVVVLKLQIPSNKFQFSKLKTLANL